ncbi:hypothetical protein EIP91_008083 [Steccherinum ochraceum]|uniref:NAD(P)-binding protein n=1 Tax=Steccherinum ochraceum TaxID=92696 RepID=A0A4V2MX98_9APHY|nr:hypothetical protein EIP91_008083 [Steccherinum ochraceum]
MSNIQVNTLFSMEGRVALISGGGTGIGSYVAQGLVQAGAARVYITGRRPGPLNTVAQTAPNNIVSIQGDVSTIDGCKSIAARFVELEKEAGVDEPSLDLLFNNAGVIVQEGQWDEAKATPEDIRDALLKTSDKDWANVFAVNASAVQWLSAALLPYLAKAANNNDSRLSGRGCIVVNTSLSALYFGRLSQVHLYSASKAAAESLTSNLASKFTRLGVRVNSIAVAHVPSETNDIKHEGSWISMAKARGIVPVGRVGNEEDAMAAVLYLASRAGSYVSGTCIKVDGGTLIAS